MSAEARPQAGTARLGVSLGATNTVAVLRRPGRRPEPLLFDGSALLPSAVQARPDGSLATGQEALGLVRDGRQPQIRPEHALMAIFQRLAYEVRALAGDVPVETVVGCPLQSSSDERSRIVWAASAAGFAQVEIVAEPVAAGAYLVRTMRYEVPVGCSLVVVDVGAVTADVSLLRMTDSGFEPAASEQVPDAGGAALDAALTGLVRTWVAAMGETADWQSLTVPRTSGQEQAALLFRQEVRAAKEILSSQASAVVRMPSTGLLVTIPGPQFEIVAARVLARVVEAVGRMLDAVPGGEVVVLLIGGTSRMPVFARQLVAEIAPLPVILSVDEPELVVAYGCVAEAPAVLDEDVRFTVCRPVRLLPYRWESLLVFAHKSDPVVDPVTGPLDPLAEVERRARQHFAQGAARSHTVDSRSSVPRGTELRVVPELAGAECNPPAAALRWQEPVHEVQFRIRPTLPAGQVVRGFVRIWCGPLIIGEVSVALPVGTEAPTGPVELTAQPLIRYRRIFPSYSSRDRDIVDQFVAAARALGDQYLQDVLTLRTGEDWDQRLMDLIAEADVFQLFWSSNSMVSPNCRREWERALDLRRPSFVRPVYWEDPLPQAPHLGLPPQTLRALHFAKVPIPHSPAVAPRTMAVGQVSIPKSGVGTSAASGPVSADWRDSQEEPERGSYGAAETANSKLAASPDRYLRHLPPADEERYDEPSYGRHAEPSDQRDGESWYGGRRAAESSYEQPVYGKSAGGPAEGLPPGRTGSTRGPAPGSAGPSRPLPPASPLGPPPATRAPAPARRRRPAGVVISLAGLAWFLVVLLTDSVSGIARTLAAVAGFVIIGAGITIVVLGRRKSGP